MKRLAFLPLLALPCLLNSCGLAESLIQGPYRIIQSAGRTLTDASETGAPESAAPANPIEIALSK